MCGERLDALLLTDIPQLRERVASTGDEIVIVHGVDAQAHDITQMVGKLVQLRARLHIPEHARHVARGCENALVVDEATATEVARVTRKLASNAGRAFAGREIVDGADVVETTAGYVVAGR